MDAVGGDQSIAATASTVELVLGMENEFGGGHASLLGSTGRVANASGRLAMGLAMSEDCGSIPD